MSGTTQPRSKSKKGEAIRRLAVKKDLARQEEEQRRLEKIHRKHQELTEIQETQRIIKALESSEAKASHPYLPLLVAAQKGVTSQLLRVYQSQDEITKQSYAAAQHLEASMYMPFDTTEAEYEYFSSSLKCLASDEIRTRVLKLFFNTDEISQDGPVSFIGLSIQNHRYGAALAFLEAYAKEESAVFINSSNPARSFSSVLKLILATHPQPKALLPDREEYRDRFLVMYLEKNLAELKESKTPVCAEGNQPDRAFYKVHLFSDIRSCLFDLLRVGVGAKFFLRYLQEDFSYWFHTEPFEFQVYYSKAVTLFQAAIVMGKRKVVLEMLDAFEKIPEMRCVPGLKKFYEEPTCIGSSLGLRATSVQLSLAGLAQYFGCAEAVTVFERMGYSDSTDEAACQSLNRLVVEDLQNALTLFSEKPALSSAQASEEKMDASMGFAEDLKAAALEEGKRLADELNEKIKEANQSRKTMEADYKQKLLEKDRQLSEKDQKIQNYEAKIQALEAENLIYCQENQVLNKRVDRQAKEAQKAEQFRQAQATQLGEFQRRETQIAQQHAEHLETLKSSHEIQIRTLNSQIEFLHKKIEMLSQEIALHLKKPERVDVGVSVCCEQRDSETEPMDEKELAEAVAACSSLLPRAFDLQAQFVRSDMAQATMALVNVLKTLFPEARVFAYGSAFDENCINPSDVDLNCVFKHGKLTDPEFFIRILSQSLSVEGGVIVSSNLRVIHESSSAIVHYASLKLLFLGTVQIDLSLSGLAKNKTFEEVRLEMGSRVLAHQSSVYDFETQKLYQRTDAPWLSVYSDFSLTVQGEPSHEKIRAKASEIELFLCGYLENHAVRYASPRYATQKTVSVFETIPQYFDRPEVQLGIYLLLTRGWSSLAQSIAGQLKEWRFFEALAGLKAFSLPAGLESALPLSGVDYLLQALSRYAIGSGEGGFRVPQGMMKWMENIKTYEAKDIQTALIEFLRNLSANKAPVSVASPYSVARVYMNPYRIETPSILGSPGRLYPPQAW